MWSRDEESEGYKPKRKRRKKKPETEEIEGVHVVLFERKEDKKKRPRVPAEFKDGKITRLAPQKRDSNRASVYIDGVFAFGIMQAIILEFSLSSGQTLTAERQREILARSEFLRAKAYALEFLSFKPRSVHELRERMLRKEFPPDTVEKTVQRFQDIGYLNDTRFSQAFAREKIKVSRYGRRRVQMDLRKRGVAPELIERAFDEITDEDLFEAALEAGQRRWKRVSRTNQGYARVRKVTDFLARRGFDGSTIRQVTDDLKKQAAEEEEEMTEDTHTPAKKPTAYKERPLLEFEEAFSLAQKRYERLERSESDAFKRDRKLWDFLRRKGCSAEVIRTVCDQLRTDREEEEARIELERAESESKETRDQRLAEEAEREEEEFQEAVELARSRMRKLERLEKNARKRGKKLQDFLMRRGVSWEWIRRMRDEDLWSA